MPAWSWETCNSEYILFWAIAGLAIALIAYANDHSQYFIR